MAKAKKVKITKGKNTKTKKIKMMSYKKVGPMKFGNKKMIAARKKMMLDIK